MKGEVPVKKQGSHDLTALINSRLGWGRRGRKEGGLKIAMEMQGSLDAVMTQMRISMPVSRQE